MHVLIHAYDIMYMIYKIYIYIYIYMYMYECVLTLSCYAHCILNGNRNVLKLKQFAEKKCGKKLGSNFKKL